MNFRLFWLLTVVRLPIKFSVLDASDCEVLMSGIADGINSENAFLSVNGGEPAPLAHCYEGA